MIRMREKNPVKMKRKTKKRNTDTTKFSSLNINKKDKSIELTHRETKNSKSRYYRRRFLVRLW